MRAPLLVACTLGGCLLGTPGCEKLLSIQDPVAGDGPALDAADGPGPDARSCVPSGLPQNSPLLLSELALAPDAAEMIEIVNPSTDDIPLSTYYLSDSGNYYRLPVTGTTVDQSDFIVKFPDGAVIHGHKAITVAIATPTDFASSYSVAPDFSLRDGSLQTILMNGAPQLTNDGEPVILFQWDGCSDLVRDVDIMLAGIPSGLTNALPNKSNATQDGADPGTAPSKYAVDIGTIHAQAAKLSSGVSTKRILLEDGHEIHGGTGNGQSGDDETSEDTAVTWDGPPFTAPTPGVVPAALLR